MKAPRLAIMLALAIAAHAPKGQAEQVTLTFVHASMTNHPAHLAAVQFARRVEQRTNRQIKAEIYPASQLGSETETLEKLRLGAIDLQVSSVNYLIKYDKAFAVVVMPYLFDSYAHAHRVLDGPAMDWLAPLAEEQGFVILSNWEWGFRHLTNNRRPINTPEDVRGLKIRVPPVYPLTIAMEMLGADVSSIGFKELPRALSQGLVDGQENPLNVIYYNKLYETQNHLALTRHVYYSALHLMSARTWAKLTPAQKNIVREESKAAGQAMRNMIIAEEEALVARMVDAGIQVTRPALTPFRATAAPVYQQFRRYSGEENVSKFMKMVDDEQ